MKRRAKSLPVIRRKSRRKKVCLAGLICSVREEPNSVQPCQFRFKSLSSSRCKPEKTTRKTRVRIRGVFGRVEKRFPGPEKFTRKEPRKVFGPREVFGSFEKRTPEMNSFRVKEEARKSHFDSILNFVSRELELRLPLTNSSEICESILADNYLNIYIYRKVVFLD